MSALNLFRSAYTQYGAELHRYLLRRLRERDEADDALQEVYTRLLQSNEADFVRSPQAFLFGIAKNVVRERRRRAVRDPLRLATGDDPSGELEEQPGTLQEEDASEQLNLQRQLDRALEQLPPMHAAILLCIKRDGMSYAETAERVGLPRKRVERYFCEAKARLLMMRWDR